MNLREFVPLSGNRPSRILDRHPDGVHLALQLAGNFGDGFEQRAGVWHAETKRLVWHEDRVTALAWFPGGDELALTRSEQAERDDRGVFVRPWYFERRTWPSVELVARCAIRSRLGWFTAVAVSSQLDRAAATWNDQGEAGFIEISLASEVAQLPDAWETEDTNWIEGPVYAPDGSTLALVLNPDGAGNWWGGEEDDEPSPGGMFEVAQLVLLDASLRELRREPLRVDVPRGWLPGDDEPARGTGRPRYLDEALVVDLPLGAEHRLPL